MPVAGAKLARLRLSGGPGQAPTRSCTPTTATLSETCDAVQVIGLHGVATRIRRIFTQAAPGMNSALAAAEEAADDQYTADHDAGNAGPLGNGLVV